jgi:hypothetical protein
MKITPHNVDPASGVIAIDGPHVPVVLGDSGSAHVNIVLALSDGRSFGFPDTAGRPWPQTTTLPPGDYACTVVVAAHGHGSFGRGYDCGVVIGDKLVATAEGAIPDGDDSDIGLRSFILRVA